MYTSLIVFEDNPYSKLWNSGCWGQFKVTPAFFITLGESSPWELSGPLDLCNGPYILTPMLLSKIGHLKHRYLPRRAPFAPGKR